MKTTSLPLFLWPLVLLTAATAYFYSLGGLYIPHIGDEAPYIEIARLTGESGQWLPLKTAPGLENTKPPLLYWLGIVSTRIGGSFTLSWLRLPIVLITFITAGVVCLVARRLTGASDRAAFAGLIFLGFHTSFQYGRPFLTNLPETLTIFVALALLVLAGKEAFRWPFVIAIGTSLGLACLFKSFVLVVPAAAGLTGYAYVVFGRDRHWFFFRALPGIFGACLIALMWFGLWPLLDPHPAEILRHFVVEENLGKLDADGYWTGVVSGPYALYRLWLGPVVNGGLFALPLTVLVVHSVRSRHRLGSEEKGLWVFVVAFLVVYSVPSQRQENYLLPTMPALAILLAMSWPSIERRWLRVFCVPGLVVALGLLWGTSALGTTVLPEGSYRYWQLALIAAAAGGWVMALLRPRIARLGFPVLVLGTYLSLSLATAPFEGAAGRFQPEHVERLVGREVYVPESFIRRHERHRFLLPGARIEPYDPLDTKRVSQLLANGHFVVIHRSLTDTETGPFRVFARRLDIRSRLPLAEMWRIVVERRPELLIRQELIVRRFNQRRLEGLPDRAP